MSAAQEQARELIRSLRSARLREGSYSTTVNGETVATPFTDPQTVVDALDLLVVLAEEHSSGSPNLEIEQTRSLVASLEEGRPLSLAEQGLLGRLISKYAAEIAALRRSPDKQGQDRLAVPTTGTAQ